MRKIVVLVLTLLVACGDGRLSPQGGTLTGVSAGSGVTGGGTAGNVAVNVGAGSGITVAADSVAIDPTYTQRRVGATCAIGSSIRVIAEDGSVTCESDDLGGGGVGDGDKSDITVSGGGGVWTIDAAVVNFAKMADLATARIIGRTTAGTGSPEALTGTQVTGMLDTFTSGAKGLAPASGGGTTNYLRADGTYAAPPGNGVVTPVVQATALTGTQNNFALSAATTALRIDSASALTLTGMAAGVDGRVVTIMNNTTLTATILHQTSSSAANQFATGNAAANPIGARTAVDCIYDATAQKWRVQAPYRLKDLVIEGSGTALSISSGNVSVGGNTTTSGATTTNTLAVNTTSAFTGAATFNGGVTLGDATADAVSVLGTITANTAPVTIGELRGAVQVSTETTPLHNAVVGANVMFWRPNSSGSLTVSGISATGRGDGSLLCVENTTGNVMVFQHENAGSLAANRFETINADSWDLYGGGHGCFVYDTTKSRWSMMWMGTERVPAWIVSGSTTLSGTTTVGGNFTATGTTNQIGNAATDTLDIQATTTIAGDATLGVTVANLVTVVGDLTVADTVNLNGNTTIGNANTDTVTLTAKINSPVQSTGTPTASTCGTSPTVVGGILGFRVTVGSGTVPACTLTFASTFANAPTCVTSLGNAGANVDLYIGARSTTAITIENHTAQNMAGTTIDVICVGH